MSFSRTDYHRKHWLQGWGTRVATGDAIPLGAGKEVGRMRVLTGQVCYSARCPSRRSCTRTGTAAQKVKAHGACVHFKGQKLGSDTTPVQGQDNVMTTHSTPTEEPHPCQSQVTAHTFWFPRFPRNLFTIFMPRPQVSSSADF